LPIFFGTSVAETVETTIVIPKRRTAGRSKEKFNFICEVWSRLIVAGGHNLFASVNPLADISANPALKELPG
jgi:hypothetical protein